MQPVLPLGGQILHGRFVDLEPLQASHHDGLTEAARDRAIFAYMPFEPGEPFESRLRWYTEQNEAGSMISFTVRRRADGTILGSSSYLAIAPEHAKVEIGATWYRPDVQGTAVNPESKYLLLDHAFGRRWNRIEFKTDSRNARSRAALKKLGAIEEGALRHHMWMPQGYFRDSVYFSILASEWLAVKAGLAARLEGFDPSPAPNPT